MNNAGLSPEKRYDFRARLASPHRPDRRDPNAVKPANAVEIDASWHIVCPAPGDGLLYTAARDLEDYFAVSMGVFLGCSDTPAGKSIVYEVDPTMADGAYAVEATDDRVTLRGATEKLCARAGYLLEDLCNLAEAPFVEKKTTRRTVPFSPRMVHSGFALDEFPDGYLACVAHAGIDAILVFVRGVHMTPNGHRDFCDIVRRAAKYGIAVYAYSFLLNEMYPEGKEAEAYYDRLYGDLFRAVPGLAGIVFVGESAEFPSRDPHTTTGAGSDAKDLRRPGWWPCCDYNVWLDMVKTAIRRASPEADVVFWSYNWGFAPEADRIALIDSLPTDISLLVTFEMFEYYEREGVRGRAVDYTLSFEGPGQYFVSEAKAAKRRGITLYAMANTGGMTWDVGTVPYIPAPYAWLRRCEAVKKAHDDYGLSGLMEGHHYGFTPSFVSDFIKVLYEDPAADPEATLRALAARDFSPETADTVLQAYRLMSDAVRDLISTNPDQYGPMRVGAAYPLMLETEEYTFRTPPYAFYGKNTICRPVYSGVAGMPPHKTSASTFGFFRFPMSEAEEANYRGLTDVYTVARDLFERAAALLDGALASVPAYKRDNAARIALLAAFIAHTVRTTVNVKNWYLLRARLFDDAEPDKKAVAARMKEIAEAEIANSEETIPLVRADSRLGYEPTMDCIGDEEGIRDKIAFVRRMIDEELEKYL